MFMSSACKVKEQVFAPSYSEITTEWKCYDLTVYFDELLETGSNGNTLAGLTELPAMIALIQPAANQYNPIIHLFPQSENEGNKMLFARGLFEDNSGGWFLGNIHIGVAEGDGRKDVTLIIESALPSPTEVTLNSSNEDDNYFLYEPKFYVKP